MKLNDIKVVDYKITNYTKEHCYHRLRIEYLRDLDKIIFKPCCTCYLKSLEEPIVWNSDYFIEHVNQCIDEYRKFTLNDLSKWYTGCCMQSSFYGNQKIGLCHEYLYNAELDTIENSILTTCNIKCIMCTCRNDVYNKKEAYLYNRLFDELNYKDCTVVTTQCGEPLLYKKELFNLIKQRKWKHMTILTNGTLLTENDIDFLSKYKDYIDIIISIDADIKDIYETIRVGANFDIVYENLKTLIEKGLLKTINCVVIKENESIVKDMNKRLLDLGLFNIHWLHTGKHDISMDKRNIL